MLRSMARRVRRLVAARTNDAGQALLFVLIALALLMSIPLAIATTTVDQLPQTSRNLNWDAAYEAAQAGLNDYLQKIDENGSYSQYNKGTPDGNAAFSSWVQASTTPLEYYSYAPAIAPATGLISLEVSGKAGSGATAVVRTFDYTVRPASSLDDVYWSNYETVDPSIGGGSGCGSWYNPGPPRSPSSSCDIEFDGNDILDGPVFSNDTFRICGQPTFDSTVESGNSNVAAGYIEASGCSSFSTSGFLDGLPTIVSNTPPQASIPSADITAALADGCEFTGGVTLVLSVSSGHTVITWSGGTLAANSKSWCTSPISEPSMTAGLIYAAGAVTVSGNMTGGLDIMSGSNITVPGNLEYSPQTNIVTAANGTESDGTDALGLVATNSVILSPPNGNGMTIDGAILALQDSFYLPNWGGVPNEGTLTVFGSIAQDFRGPVGTANSNGTVATGFAKSYHYDTSLQTLWPPYFVPPNSAAWGATTYSECAAGLAYSVLGVNTVC